jgi:hypothetical protein
MSMAARFLIGTLLAAAGFGAAAQDVVRPGQERWTFMLGAFLPAFKTETRVDNDQLGSGDNVNLSDDLGVDQDETGGWFGAEWRFAPRHRLGFTFSRFTPSGERAIDRQIQIDDEIYPVGATVSSRLKLEIIPITYSYSFLKRKNDELALTAGLHWTRATFNVEGSASAGGADASAEASSKANVPLPLFGLRYDHHFSNRWSAGASAAVFALQFGEETWDFEGTLWSVRLHAEYRFARNFAIGAALEASM